MDINSACDNKVNGKKYLLFIIATYVGVFLLNVLNSTAMNMLLQSVSTNVRFSGTILPHVLYYTMSVLAIVWQFTGVAAIADCISRRKTALAAVSALLFFAAMMSSSMLPIIVAAFQYSSQTLSTLMTANSAALLADAISGIVRVLLAVLICLGVCAIARRREKNRISAALSSVAWCSVMLTLSSMLIIFTGSTLPFLQSAGRNALQSQLPTIILEYVILAVYGVLGYAVGAIYVRAAKKI
ncbi:MAG: hypothetical protein IJN63_04890 [Clostridia bacterium]|nr:hypothetical protein [Clostridia bacterium]